MRSRRLEDKTFEIVIDFEESERLVNAIYDYMKRVPDEGWNDRFGIMSRLLDELTK